ncbi:phasin family protein [Desulfothermobacter acidiphilus]|uniref:phasin family protein n=1 Tax=Desulfothermobacter acidiphilus TaxID=1938353 RepID=UPI003F8C1123
MAGVLQEAMWVGIGAFSLTKEKMEKLLQELREKGKTSSREVRTLWQELKERGAKEHTRMCQTTKAKVEKMRSQLGWVSRQEWEDLIKRIERLEALLQEKGSSATETH